MNAHRFEPISAVLGVGAVGAGAVVIAGVGDVSNGTQTGAWIAGVALLAGVVLLPWGRRSRHDDRPNSDGGERET